MRGHLAVHVRIDDHLIVKAVDAVVQHRSVGADLHARRIGQGAEKRQRVIDLGGDRVLADALIKAALPDSGSVPVTENQPDPCAPSGFLPQQCRQVGLLGQEHPYVDQHIDVCGRSVQQAVPQIRRDKAAVGVDMNDLRPLTAPASSGEMASGHR